MRISDWSSDVCSSDLMAIGTKSVSNTACQDRNSWPMASITWPPAGREDTHANRAVSSAARAVISLGSILFSIVDPPLRLPSAEAPERESAALVIASDMHASTQSPPARAFDGKQGPHDNGLRAPDHPKGTHR